MFIQTESTPNPNSLKFILEQEISAEGTFEFNSIEDCENSELAADDHEIVTIDCPRSLDTCECSGTGRSAARPPPASSVPVSQTASAALPLS